MQRQISGWKLALLPGDREDGIMKTSDQVSPSVSPKDNDNSGKKKGSSEFLCGTLGDIKSEEPSPTIKPSRSAEIARHERSVFQQGEQERNGSHHENAETLERRHAEFPEWVIRDDTDFSTEISSSSTATASATGSFQGLVTTSLPGGTLQSRFDFDMSPLDRIILTANGNLQRILSSYYDAPVYVHVHRCVLRPPRLDEKAQEWKNGSSNYNTQTANGRSSVPDSSDKNAKTESLSPSKPPAVWDRTVHLSVHGQTLCVANSVITVHSLDCVQLIHSGKVGLGQLYHYLELLPRFDLQQAGRRSSGELWRRYTLESPQVSSVIEEEFTPNVWNIEGVGDEIMGRNQV